MRWYSNMSGNGGFFTKNERTNEIQRRDRADGRRTDIGLRVHEAPHPQDSAGMLQLRRVHSGRGRPYRAADQPGVHRPEHVQPAGAAARQLDGRGARPAPRGRSVRLHPHDVQRGRTRRVRLRQDRQGAPPAYPCRVADQFLEGHLPPYRRARRFGHRLHLLVERQYRSGDRHHQTHRGCDERRGGHPHRGRAGHPARRGFGAFLFDLSAGALQADPATEHRVPERRLQRTAADPAQARPSQDPAGDQLRRCRGALRAI